jgi:hypothetical protein
LRSEKKENLTKIYAWELPVLLQPAGCSTAEGSSTFLFASVTIPTTTQKEIEIKASW